MGTAHLPHTCKASGSSAAPHLNLTTMSTRLLGSRSLKVKNGSVAVMSTKSQKGRWRGIDADMDMSDDQQDITRGRMMVDSLFQGASGMSGTHNAIMSSEEYLSQAQRSLNNIEDGFYISPAFLDKISIHVAK